MRTINKSFKQDDDFIHPFWLEIFILFTVIMIIGILCCLRKKCGSSVQRLFKRLFSHKNEAHGNITTKVFEIFLVISFNKFSISISLNNYLQNRVFT